MKIMEKNNNAQKGLTLVEILAALVILGIVFISFMTIFPQMTLFNNKTETKLDTMNLARQEISNITAKGLWTKEIIVDPTKVKTTLSLNYTLITGESNPEAGFDSDTVSPAKSYKRYKIKNSQINNYTFDLLIYDEPDLPGDISLYKVILRVKTLNGVNSSETYGYIEVK